MCAHRLRAVDCSIIAAQQPGWVSEEKLYTAAVRIDGDGGVSRHAGFRRGQSRIGNSCQSDGWRHMPFRPGGVVAGKGSRVPRQLICSRSYPGYENHAATATQQNNGIIRKEREGTGDLTMQSDLKAGQERHGRLSRS
jgi:hypothetical protein